MRGYTEASEFGEVPNLRRDRLDGVVVIELRQRKKETGGPGERTHSLEP